MLRTRTISGLTRTFLLLQYDRLWAHQSDPEPKIQKQLQYMSGAESKMKGYDT